MEIKIIMLKSGLCDHSDEYIIVKKTVTSTRGLADFNAAAIKGADKRNEKVVFKNCAFTECIRKIINPQVDYAKDVGIVMLRHNLIE